MLKQTAATAALAACILAILMLAGSLLGHPPFESPVSHLSPEQLLEPWIR